MFRLTRLWGWSLLALCLVGTSWGCGGTHTNEDEFAKNPGTTPPGAQANSEAAAPSASAQPAPGKAR